MPEKLSDIRLIATVVIWAVVFFIVTSVTGPAVNHSLDATLVAIATLIVAFLSTAAVWFFASLTDMPLDDPAQAEKAKRTLNNPGDTRAQLLLELLSPEEKARLKARLLNDLDAASEGELSLDDLLAR